MLFPFEKIVTIIEISALSDNHSQLPITSLAYAGRTVGIGLTGLISRLMVQ
jgi:hypothetical protein